MDHRLVIQVPVILGSIIDLDSYLYRVFSNFVEVLIQKRSSKDSFCPSLVDCLDLIELELLVKKHDISLVLRFWLKIVTDDDFMIDVLFVIH